MISRKKIIAPAVWRAAWAACLAGAAAVVGASGCQLNDAGLDPNVQPGMIEADAAIDGATSDAADAPAPVDTGDGQGAEIPSSDALFDVGGETITDGAGEASVDAPGIAPAIAGCADGTREGLVDPIMYPAVAACDGAWAEPGLLSAPSRAPECNRAAGNDGALPSGTGCSAADLCADGWHVCESIGDLLAHGGQCADAVLPANGRRVFYATRQDGACLTTDAGIPAADGGRIHGCGNFGDDDTACLTMGVVLSAPLCATNAPWQCSSLVATTASPVTTVVKSAADRGGVLCCHN
ncbi:MAG TPA: hypothetical protein VGL59_23865 [Polyangia bacterium]